MRQNMADIAPLPVEMDDYDQAVLVASDIEHDELANLICTTKELSHIREIRPASTFNGFEPVS